MDLRASDIDRLDQIHCKAAKPVTGALLFSNKKELFIKLGWEPLKVRYACLGHTRRFFSAPTPKKLEYKIPLYPLALREISDQLTWDLVL